MNRLIVASDLLVCPFVLSVCLRCAAHTLTYVKVNVQ